MSTENSTPGQRHPFFAHSANREGRWETQVEHVTGVASRCRDFGEALGVASQAEAAGLLHDLGKYADQFQNRLRDPRIPGRDHGLAGALIALKCYKNLGLLPAVAILGHHVGLGELTSSQDSSPAWRRLAEKLVDTMRNSPLTVTETNIRLLKERFDADMLRLPTVAAGLEAGVLDADDMLDTRMLFSALVDADFVETEAHFAGDLENPRRYRSAGPELDPERALAAVERHVRQLDGGNCGSEWMGHIRTQLRQLCLDAAARPVGPMTLSAPTGSGKTLAMLSFALCHALRHNLRRIVLVMPFLNIIDQAARLYRSIFSPESGFPENYVLEDHSLAGRLGDQQVGQTDAVDESDRTRRLLAENWDSPIVLTTNVKCLESMMSNRPGACRKLHRLARSVLMFDEVQTLPIDLVTATLATLSRLSGRFGSTVLFATATQPAFDHLGEKVRTMSSAGWTPVEIVPPDEVRRMFASSATRTQVTWEHGQPIELADLANRLTGEPTGQVLCILNLRRHARRLAELVQDRRPADVLHLSTDMCPLHRHRVIEQVNSRLKPQSAQPILLIATQCVEAGVDLDFPVVYRALAPLESIAQAAGRCNRHGVRPQPGRVHVFTPAGEGRAIYPPGYGRAAEITHAFLTGLLKDGAADPPDVLHDPARLKAYFQTLYRLSGVGEGASARERELRQAMEECDFVKVASLYRLINEDAINILVPYDRDAFERLRDQMVQVKERKTDHIRSWIQAARPHAVGVYRPCGDDPLWTEIDMIPLNRAQATGEEPGEWFYALPGLRYDDLLGLRPPDQFDLFA